MKIAIGCDAAGFILKDTVVSCLARLGHEYFDYGTYNEESCDYPDFALAVAESVAGGKCEKGILLCGTGIGMAICANKVKGVRAAVCNDEFSAKATAAHNDSNVLAIGGRIVDKGLAERIVSAWLSTIFEGGRHKRRVDKIDGIEARYFK
ncbi:MAG: ribose 5-phosphate isomerase B [Clostridiales bacterium]|jgi:ribose 5-phosphate isomerase B|nr:ribose 5-phosphate isomerase B [Clostridiales bacterium]